MAKKTDAFEVSLPAREKGVPAYRWLYSTLRQGVLEGRLRAGTRLPSTRDLARQYGLSRGTIVTTFELLTSEGYLEGSVGSGTYVSKVLPEELLEIGSQGGPGGPVLRIPRRRLSQYAKRARLFHGLLPRPSRAFRSNIPALDLFPTTLWAQIAARRLRRAPVSLLTGCEAMGYKPLREAVAEYLKTSRGVNCNPEQIAIVSGVQEALETAARLLLDPGDRVCMEDPGYVGAKMVFEGVGAKIAGLALDEEGMQVHGTQMQGTRMVYITPAHQYPVGITMSLSRRLELLEWARKTGALIFEDDYDSEYRYAGRPVPSLQGLDRSGVVLFSGSFNKVLFPSMRLGYLVVPADLVTYFEAVSSVTKRHAPLIEQAVVCDFIMEGHFGRHLRRMREVYAERLAVLLESARKNLDGLLEVSGIEAGMQTVGWLCKGITGKAAARAAAERNVEVFPLGAIRRGQTTQEALHLGFAAVDAQEIRRGVRELAVALETEARRTGK
jgi:GntR family transcriptional regulator / MocR family aminotransferase